jgi:hypothetical protein
MVIERYKMLMMTREERTWRGENEGDEKKEKKDSPSTPNGGIIS